MCADLSYKTLVHKTLEQALEWPLFLERAAQEALTAPGKVRVMSYQDPTFLAPDPLMARLYQQETQEMSLMQERSALWEPLRELPDPLSFLDLLLRGGVLEVEGLAVIRRWLYAMDSWNQTPREGIQGEKFKKALSLLPDSHEALRILESILNSKNELSEKASPKLYSLYSETRALKKEIEIVLDHLMKSYFQKGILQENFSDVRDGRFVIPVKISCQNEIEGNIYEASVSKQTVFIEPKEVSVLNNKLRLKQNELVQEIFIILEATSKRLQPFAQEISQGVSTLVYWDAVQARARIGRKYSGKAVSVVEERRFVLKQTAHPFLWWTLPVEKIVRNDIEFVEPKQTLLLTGPNTGGKTVLLKTLGLASLCARSGFPFPGTDQLIVPFFDSVFADLGDPQSIEQHLSSFAGHILRFKEILESGSENSLVLIDELNTATDPEEGAALGRAFLETLMQRKAMIVATTHDPSLKALGASDERVLNASFAFDEGTYQPTYKTYFGIPGRSRALETASRLGLPEKLLELARKYLSKEHLAFEKLLSKLESDTHLVSQARKEAITLREEAERLKKEWTERTKTSFDELLDRTRQRLRRILEQAQDEVRSSVRKLDEARTRKDLDQTRSGLNQSFSSAVSQIDSALELEAPSIVELIGRPAAENVDVLPEPTLELKVGEIVRVPKWKSTAKILEVLGGKIKVSMGNLQMNLSLSDVELLTQEELQKQGLLKKKELKVIDQDRPATPPGELDLRGVRLDEALGRLEQYLDQAFRSGGLRQVTIVHGLGSGALREGTRKFLGALPYIKSFQDGGVGKGGVGATVVEFDLE